jgi:hypothetical protein
MRACMPVRRAPWLWVALTIQAASLTPTSAAATDEKGPGDGVAGDEAADADVSGPRLEQRRALDEIHVYWQPRRADRRGWIAEDAVFEVGERVDGSSCASSWARVPGGGYVCLDDTEPASGDRLGLPAAYPGAPLPFLYAARGGNPAFSYAFVGMSVDDDGNGVLVRPDGGERRASRYEIHPESSFHGRDLRTKPVPEGTLPAWAVVEDVPVYPSMRSDAEPARLLPKHAAIVVDRTPAGDAGHWYRVPDGIGPGRDGYVRDEDAVRHWSPAPPLDDVDAHELWLDLDLEQQVIALRRGTAVIYVTLVSSGTDARPTPRGVFRVRDKRAWTSMGHLPTSADRYFIERVPWTMYFRDYYAIHGAYWHDQFGEQRSHGCVNLAPRDAKLFYEVLSPRSERGFLRTYASDANPGSLIRIRHGDEPVPDRTDESY